MAGGPIIDVTNFIDERRFSWFQGRVLALCILLQICDGIDLQAIGYTGARIRAELHPSLGEMAGCFPRASSAWPAAHSSSARSRTRSAAAP